MAIWVVESGGGEVRFVGVGCDGEGRLVCGLVAEVAGLEVIGDVGFEDEHDDVGGGAGVFLDLGDERAIVVCGGALWNRSG